MKDVIESAYMKDSKIKLFIKLFLGIEVLLYLGFMLPDICDGGSGIGEILKYSSIILCVVMAWDIYYGSRSRVSLIIALAMVCTAFSDAFLLFPRDVIWPGVFSFCIAHFLYMSIIHEFKAKRIAVEAGIRILLAGVLFIPLCDSVLYSYPTVFLLSLYAVTFFLNVVECGIYMVSRSPLRLFFVGLVLFVLCDVCVAMHNLTGSVMDIDRFSGVYRVSGVLMWAFYLPSQVVIVLSSWRSREVV